MQEAYNELTVMPHSFDKTLSILVKAILIKFQYNVISNAVIQKIILISNTLTR